MFDLDAIQAALREFGLDGWLLYDFRGSNVPARRVLGLEGKPTGSRRFLYAIPARGAPRKLVHRIESHHLDPLKGSKSEYSSWEELHENLKKMLAPYHKVVMQYSPNNQIPYISLVDGVTYGLLRHKEVVR